MCREQPGDAVVEGALAVGGTREQCHEHAVLVREVLCQAVPAALLAAAEGSVLDHRLGDPLEPDRGLVDRPAGGRGDPVDETARGHRPHHRTRVTTLQEKLVEDREQEIRVEIAASGCHHPHTVRVAVVEETEIRVRPLDLCSNGLGRVRSGLRGHTAEGRVPRAAVSPDRRTAALQGGVGDGSSAPVHGVVGDGEPREVDSDAVEQVLDVGLAEVSFLDLPGCLGRGVRWVGGLCGESPLQCVGRRGEGRHPLCRENLHTVVPGRVV